MIAGNASNKRIVVQVQTFQSAIARCDQAFGNDTRQLIMIQRQVAEFDEFFHFGDCSGKLIASQIQQRDFSPSQVIGNGSRQLVRVQIERTCGKGETKVVSK